MLAGVLGLEPRLFGTRIRRVASYTTPQYHRTPVLRREKVCYGRPQGVSTLGESALVLLGGLVGSDGSGRSKPSERDVSCRAARATRTAGETPSSPSTATRTAWKTTFGLSPSCSGSVAQRRLDGGGVHGRRLRAPPRQPRATVRALLRRAPSRARPRRSTGSANRNATMSATSSSRLTRSETSGASAQEPVVARARRRRRHRGRPPRATAPSARRTARRASRGCRRRSSTRASRGRRSRGSWRCGRARSSRTSVSRGKTVVSPSSDQPSSAR